MAPSEDNCRCPVLRPSYRMETFGKNTQLGNLLQKKRRASFQWPNLQPIEEVVPLKRDDGHSACQLCPVIGRKIHDEFLRQTVTQARNILDLVYPHDEINKDLAQMSEKDTGEQ